MASNNKLHTSADKWGWSVPGMNHRRVVHGRQSCGAKIATRRFPGRHLCNELLKWYGMHKHRGPKQPKLLVGGLKANEHSFLILFLLPNWMKKMIWNHQSVPQRWSFRCHPPRCFPSTRLNRPDPNSARWAFQSYGRGCTSHRGCR